MVPVRVVQLLWFAPTLCEWQVESMEERGLDVVPFKRAIDQIREQVQRILGMP